MLYADLALLRRERMRPRRGNFDCIRRARARTLREFRALFDK
jgi:hypothetical protein